MSEPNVLLLPDYAARFQTRVTELTFNGTDRQAVIGKDAQRWYIRFDPGQGGGGSQAIIPDPGTAVINASTIGNLPKEYHFRDCPSVTTGGFVGWGMIGSSVIITEDIFLGS